MIQRVQTIYLLAAIISYAIIIYLPMGTVNSEVPLIYYIYGYRIADNRELIDKNLFLSFSMGLITALQLVSIFSYKNRKRQLMLTSLSLILLVAATVAVLLYNDLFPVSAAVSQPDLVVNFNWNILLMAIPWILTYLAIRAIRKDNALVRSAERMR